MSTVGSANVVTAPVTVSAAGVGITEASMGIGIMIAQGIMWCGRKLRENYTSACQSYTDQFQRALAEERAKAQDRQFALAALIEQITDSPHLQAFATGTADTAAEQGLNEALQRAHAALDSAEQVGKLREAHEQALERRRLEAALVASQGLVSKTILDETGRALTGSTSDMRRAYERLQQEHQKALAALSDTQLQRASQVRQAQYILAQVGKEMQSVRLLLTQSYGKADQRYQSDIASIEQLMREAQQRLDTSSSIGDPKRALTDAEAAQKAVEKLKQQVSFTLTAEWDERRKQAVVARARLAALQKIVQEAIGAGVLEAARGQTLQARIGAFEQHIMQAANQSSGAKSLLGALAPFSQEIIREVNEGQQQRIAETIATTLSEMGFRDDLTTGTPPRVEMIGEEISIRAKRRGGMEPGMQGHDEKLVVFYIDREGAMNYDFSGYTGNECVREAERIFAALRTKGLAVVDHAALPQISHRPPQEVIPQLLHDAQLAPRFDVNKRQEHLRATLMGVLRDRMGFTTIREFGSGGTVVIDAYNGPLGYHVQLSQEGEARISRNGVDVSHDPGDQLAAAAQTVPQVQQEQPEQAEQEEFSWLDDMTGEQGDLLLQ
jgi:hypothetical protein